MTAFELLPTSTPIQLHHHSVSDLHVVLKKTWQVTFDNHSLKS